METMNWEFVTTLKDFAQIIYTLVLIYVAWRVRQVEKNTNSMKDALVASAKLEGASVEKDAAVVRQAEAIVSAETVKAALEKAAPDPVPVVVANPGPVPVVVEKK